jgi:hypothetical protein
MKLLHALRLLLDVLGALFLGIVTIAPLVYGVLPYEGLNRLGTIPFYGLLAAALALWVWLVARSIASTSRQAPRTPATRD